MASFLAAHGYDPGPSQRPLTAGAISGVLATLVAIPILLAFGSLKVESAIIGLSPVLTIGIGCVAMAGAGALYARIFGRAANNVRGGWLFGMAFGFLLWAGGAVLVLPIVFDGRAPAGSAATGLALSMLAWGLAAGILLPFVHRPLDQTIEQASRHPDVGPNAAAGPGRPSQKQHKPGKPNQDNAANG